MNHVLWDYLKKLWGRPSQRWKCRLNWKLFLNHMKKQRKVLTVSKYAILTYWKFSLAFLLNVTLDLNFLFVCHTLCYQADCGSPPQGWWSSTGAGGCCPPTPSTTARSCRSTQYLREKQRPFPWNKPTCNCQRKKYLINSLFLSLSILMGWASFLYGTFKRRPGFTPMGN